MGRTAAPAGLKLVKGRAPGKDSGGREVTPPPAFKRLPPTAPSWMSREAKAEWKRVVPELARLELLKSIDRAALTVYCETWATYVDAIREARRTGMSIETETGAIKRNPAIAASHEAAALLRGMAQEFGLTPSSEAKLGLLSRHGDLNPDNPFG